MADACGGGDPSAHAGHYKQSSSASSLNGKAQPSQVSFKQAKRNELCEVLRAEIQALQEECASKNGVIVGLKMKAQEELEARRESAE